MQSKRIHVDLIKGLGEDKAEDFVREYENCKRVLLRMRELLEKEIQKSYITEEQIVDDLPVNLAKALGKRQGLREVLKYFPDQGQTK